MAQEHQEYIQTKVNPILESLVTQVLLERPENPVPFMIGWLADQVQAPQADKVDRGAEIARLQSEIAVLQGDIKELEESTGVLENYDAEEEEDDDDDMEDLPPPPTYGQKGPRASVSAEAYGKWNQKKAFTPPVHPKTENQKVRIKAVLEKSFLFAALDEKELDVIILAMLEKPLEPGVRIIQEGDDGDFLCVVETGTMDCYKNIQGTEKVVKTCGAGDAFGELALLYNCPRAASVQSRDKCLLWQLDRDTFNAIVKDAAAAKRNKYESFLKTVTLLESMDHYERSQLADALKQECFKNGDQIVKQGDPGDKFYIVAEGSAVAVKSGQEVMHYKEGDYFGELALLKNEPRAASINAKSELKVLSVDRRTFKSLLGPLEDILKRNTARYEGM